MHVIPSAAAAPIALDGVVFFPVAAPSLGARESCLWRVVLAQGAVGQPHHVSCEELIHAVSGRAIATVNGKELQVNPGDTLVVSAGQEFSLRNAGEGDFEALTVAPRGLVATTAQGSFAPPWTL